ncbi:MAG: TauD/TfdA family dioxygenase [Cyclobacteriaceae bacterium]
MNNLHKEANTVQDDFLVIKQFDDGISTTDFVEWYRTNESTLQDELLKSGAIMFRGIDIKTMEHFESVMDQISSRFMAYVDGNSPRTKLTSKVYTSTEYDKNHSITLHNELSYSYKWPAKIFFCSIITAEEGGETPIADCRRVLKSMDRALAEEIEAKGITYIRNLNGGAGFGPSWQDTFETSDKADVEKFCTEAGINYSWKDDGGLKLIQPSKGIISHPVSGDKVWFNQIDQFHPSHLDEEIYETLMMMYEDEAELPMYVSFGDGTKITQDMVNEIRRTMDKESLARPWQQGDLLMLDNVLVADGRKPYKGDRKVLVSMSN